MLFSLILKISVNTIYIFFFEPSGRRGFNIFRFIITILNKMILGRFISDKELFTIIILLSLTVLNRLIEIN